MDVFDTVSQMRKQRMKMIRKADQYSYIFKCLKNEIKTKQMKLLINSLVAMVKMLIFLGLEKEQNILGKNARIFFWR